MKISRELGAEVEEQRVALERLPVREENTLQLSVWVITLERDNLICSDRDIQRLQSCPIVV
jgi:hypothetical protein